MTDDMDTTKYPAVVYANEVTVGAVIAEPCAGYLADGGLRCRVDATTHAAGHTHRLTVRRRRGAPNLVAIVEDEDGNQQGYTCGGNKPVRVLVNWPTLPDLAPAPPTLRPVGKWATVALVSFLAASPQWPAWIAAPAMAVCLASVFQAGRLLERWQSGGGVAWLPPGSRRAFWPILAAAAGVALPVGTVLVFAPTLVYRRPNLAGAVVGTSFLVFVAFIGVAFAIQAIRSWKAGR